MILYENLIKKYVSIKNLEYYTLGNCLASTCTAIDSQNGSLRTCYTINCFFFAHLENLFFLLLNLGCYTFALALSIYFTLSISIFFIFLGSKF